MDSLLITAEMSTLGRNVYGKPGTETLAACTRPRENRDPEGAGSSNHPPGQLSPGGKKPGA